MVAWIEQKSEEKFSQSNNIIMQTKHLLKKFYFYFIINPNPEVKLKHEFCMVSE
jgi:hypothetical protein